MTAEPVTAARPLSQMLREGTSGNHKAAERRPFMRVFFRSELSREAYAEYLARLSFVYAALEEAAEALKPDPVVGRMYSPELLRSEALDRDLTFFVGRDWRSKFSPSPVSRAYADRIRWTEKSWPPGFVPNQWLRYLGSLSGGKVLKGIVQKAYGLTDEGISFYEFPGIDDPPAYLRDYHVRMDSMPVDDETKLAMVEEGNRAFQFNMDLTDELAADLGIEAPGGNESDEIDALKHGD